MTVMPEAITSKTEVYYLNMFNMLDLRDIEASGIRNIKNMKKIEDLNLSSCYLDRYIKEFNDLPKLKTLNITPAPVICGIILTLILFHHLRLIK